MAIKIFRQKKENSENFGLKNFWSEKILCTKEIVKNKFVKTSTYGASLQGGYLSPNRNWSELALFLQSPTTQPGKFIFQLKLP